jgi:KipI family sensor histidine kinase inhibitor
MRIMPCGDTALLLEVGSLPEVMSLHASLSAAGLPGLLDLVPAARTVLVRFDPQAVSAAGIRRRVERVSHLPEISGRWDTGGRELVEIAVRYDGPDLEAVGELTGLGAAGVVAAHTNQMWTVAFGGFSPGFGYLVGTDHRLHVRRRDTPRTSVPAGSVGLAGEFSGVYPRSSPGGWQLIGRTDAPLWDVDRDPPALLRPGVRVRFREPA